MATPTRYWEDVYPQKHIDSGTALSHGLIPNWKQITKFGHNKDLDTGVEETIRSEGGVWQPSTSAEIVDIVSTSANDTNSTGTHSWAVYIFGLDENYVEVEETVLLNGLSIVKTTNSYLYINRAVVLNKIGESQSANFTNDGDISFTQTSSGLQLSQIDAGDQITHTTVYTIPAGYKAYLKGLYVNAGNTSVGASPEFKLVLYSFNPKSYVNYNVADIVLNTSVQNNLWIPQPNANESDEKVTLYLNAISDKDNSTMFVKYHLHLVKIK